MIVMHILTSVGLIVCFCSYDLQYAYAGCSHEECCF